MAAAMVMVVVVVAAARVAGAVIPVVHAVYHRLTGEL